MVTRRDFLKGVLIFGSMAIGLVGCSESSAQSNDTTSNSLATSASSSTASSDNATDDVKGNYKIDTDYVITTNYGSKSYYYDADPGYPVYKKRRIYFDGGDASPDEALMAMKAREEFMESITIRQAAEVAKEYGGSFYTDAIGLDIDAYGWSDRSMWKAYKGSFSDGSRGVEVVYIQMPEIEKL